MSIEILHPGLLTTVQDLGRQGHAAAGYVECGACDKFRYALSVLLSGNTRLVAALECTLIGPSLRFESDALIAVCGEVRPLRNGRPVRVNHPIIMRAGDVLDIGEIGGARAYVCAMGGIDVPEVLGSRSTDLRCHIGGLEGRALRAGDRLELAAHPSDAAMLAMRARASKAGVPLPPAGDTVRAVPGPQLDRFTRAGVRAFFEGEYTLTPSCDRMGLRLAGPAVEAAAGTDILSDAILEGSVQISPNGQPVVMLCDHQTLGGYAKIATVIPTDIPILAQKRPGERVRFQAIDAATAAALYRREAARLLEFQRRLEETHETGRSQRRSGRELWRLYHRRGRGADTPRHFRERRLRVPRR